MAPKRKPFINPVDGFLILFLLLLLIQSAFNLLFDQTFTADTNAIDVVVRTSAALIFGSFLSGQDKVETPSTQAKSTPAPMTLSSALPSENIPSGQIGFSAPIPSSSLDEVPSPPAFSEKPAVDTRTRPNLSVIVVALVGLFSLILLLIVRNFTTVTPGMAATLSQLRDFVCGCIGLLVRRAREN